MAIAQDPAGRFSLRMQPSQRVLLFFLVFVCAVLTIAFAVWCLKAFSAGSYAGATFMLCGAAVVGAVTLGGVLALKLRDNAGYLEVRRDGIILDSYLSTGYIPWSNFQSIDVVDANNNEHVAICLKDPVAYVDSRKDRQFSMAQELDRYQVLMRALHSGGATAFAPLLKPLTIISYILGKDYVPKSGEEVDVMRSNKDWYGFHILIPVYWFSDPRQVIAAINQHRR